MTLSRLCWTSAKEIAGGWCELLSRPQMRERAEELAARGYVVARVADATCQESSSSERFEPPLDAGEPPRSPGGQGRSGLLRRGRLHDAIHGAIELSLCRRGATPADQEAESDPRTPSERRRIAQAQLLRARDAGADGLCLVLPGLQAFSDDRGSLDRDDSQVVALWAELSVVWPIVVLVERSDSALEALVSRPLGEIIAACGRSAPRSALPATPMPAAPRGGARQSTPRPAVAVAITEPTMARRRPDQPATAAPTFDETQPSCKLAPRRIHDLTGELLRARGPQPVRVVEDLFRTRYMPLLASLSAGQPNEAAQGAVDEWRRDFERTYIDGYTALRVTGRRPSMVLDAPEIATRLARLNGARATELLLVDAMRFDLGERVVARLRAQVGDRAVCVDQTLLWAALPAITPTQLRLLETGPRGLGDREPVSEREPTIHRGGSLTTLRRLRIGRRHLLKLDLVEARLRDLGPDFEPRMDAIAEEVTEVIARFVRSLAARTLLLIFGDHGFRLPQADEAAVAGARQTLPAQQGGASPEEVLVLASAWLTGDVH